MPSLEAEEFVPPAVDTLPINFAILDDEGVIRYTNRTWRQFGEENDIELRPDTIGVNYLDVVAGSEDDTAQTAATGLTEILDGERDLLEFEYPCHSPDERRWFIMRAASFAHEGSRYVAVAHSDITQRREYRRKLEESNERLEQFAYAASHDLQEPLRMVQNYLGLLERRYGDELDDDAEEFIDFAVDGAERMEAMIQGLLEYSRVESQGQSFDRVDLDNVLDDVLQDLRLQIEENDAEITADSLPTVEGDPSQLRQVFQNVLDNAIEYSGSAPPGVRISADRNGDEWVVSIRDDGIGIDPEDTDRIFELFQRLHGREEHAGVGIGLTLCKRIVERHGGEVWIDSEPDEGTTVAFTLPAVDEDA